MFFLPSLSVMPDPSAIIRVHAQFPKHRSRSQSDQLGLGPMSRLPCQHIKRFVIFVEAVQVAALCYG